MNLLSYVINARVFKYPRISEIWFINLAVRSVMLTPVFRSKVLSIVAHFRCPASLSSLNLNSHVGSDLGPIRATNNHCESNIEDDTCNTKPKPESLNAHLSIESEHQSKRHSNNIITNEGVDGTEGLSTEASDYS